MKKYYCLKFPVATVDKYSDVLKNILGWVAINKEEVIDIKMENADPILHASLEDDKEQVQYSRNYSYFSFHAFLVFIPKILFPGQNFVWSWVQTVCRYHQKVEQRLFEENKIIQSPCKSSVLYGGF